MSGISPDALERAACVPEPVERESFNDRAVIPFGCTVEHVYEAVKAFTHFLQVVNVELNANGMPRLESLLMPANFSSVVSEFINSSIPKFCPTLAKNAYHNGHPDLVPINVYPNNAVQYAQEGIEVKASRYLSGWQGHNVEESWLMVFVFDSNRPSDVSRGIAPRPFHFIKVVGAPLTREDWSFSGRSETSRRTITASVTPAGAARMEANWIYRLSSGLPQAVDTPDDDGMDQETLN